MKKITFLLTILLFTGLTGLQAQSPKIGYVNSQELIQLMPESTKADTAMDIYMRKLDNEYKMVALEAQKKYLEYQEQKENWTASVLEAKERGLSDLQDRLQELQVNAQDSIQAKRAQLFKPILDKAQTAIESVGKENGYDYILDSSSLLYVNEAKNLLPKVKAKLGIK